MCLIVQCSNTPEKTFKSRWIWRKSKRNTRWFFQEPQIIIIVRFQNHRIFVSITPLPSQTSHYIYSYKLTMISIYMYSPISVCRAITVIEILCFGREYFLYLKAFLGEKQCDPLFSRVMSTRGVFEPPTIQLQVLKTLTITYLGTYPRYTCSPSRVFSYYCQFLQILRGLLFQIPVSEIIYFWRSWGW